MNRKGQLLLRKNWWNFKLSDSRVAWRSLSQAFRLKQEHPNQCPQWLTIEPLIKLFQRLKKSPKRNRQSSRIIFNVFIYFKLLVYIVKIQMTKRKDICRKLSFLLLSPNPWFPALETTILATLCVWPSQNKK